MILGIGVDIAEVDRITRSVSDGNHFKKRVFTEIEQNYCDGLKNFGESYAARYAAKEALFKALGTGWRGELKFTEVEVVNNELGKPKIFLHGEAKRMADKMGVKSVHVSLSHTKETAIAYLILEG
ncbi:MAG: holo-ACP synthase [Flavobacteriales bacterium]|nr:holo-ACP synthase [Flavobacteriales bacterium]